MRGSRSIPPEQRFWTKVRQAGDCWVWTASRGGTGYGHFAKKHAKETRPELQEAS